MSQPEGPRVSKYRVNLKDLNIVGAGVVLIWLMVRSSDQFTVEDTEENAENLADGAARESRGPVLTWLMVAYAVMIVWAIAYLIQHSAEFATFP